MRRRWRSFSRIAVQAEYGPLCRGGWSDSPGEDLLDLGFVAASVASAVGSKRDEWYMLEDDEDRERLEKRCDGANGAAYGGYCPEEEEDEPLDCGCGEYMFCRCSS